MDRWQIGRLVTLAGGLGMVLAAALAAAADGSRNDLLSRGTTGSLALSLLILGVAAWHFRAWGLGKLAALGLLAAGGLQFTLVDFGDGDLLWEQGFTGAELVARWLIIASAAVVLIGVLWSLAELARSRRRRSEDVAVSVAWWRKWWMAVVAGFVVLGVFGQVYGQISSDGEEAGQADITDESDDRGLHEEQWSITADGDSAGSYIFSMIKTFSPLEEADVDATGGRLVWPEIEIELCDVNIWGVAEKIVQIGIISPTTEGCPGMFSAFTDYGLPQTACLFVRSNGTESEHCAPLRLD